MSDQQPTPEYPAATAHRPIEEIFSDVFWVQGSVHMGPGVTFNRNMVILHHDGELTLISPVRLSAEGEAALEALGTVKHVIRIGYYHGMDDRYYVDKYGATFWCQDGSDHYAEPTPTQILSDEIVLPVPEAVFVPYRETKFPEGAILHKTHGLLITADSVQNHAKWTYTSMMARIITPLIGFRRRLQIGPPWKKYQTKEGGSLRSDFERLMALEFDHHIGAHGQLCRGGAKEKLKSAIEIAFG